MKKLFLLVGLAMFIALLAAGCNTMYEEKTVTDGTKTEKTVSKKRESALKDKILATASNVTGIILETSVSSSSDNILPSFKMATGGTTVVTANKDSGKLVYTKTTSAGILNSITNASATSGTTVFIGSNGDDGTGAAKFIKALAELATAEKNSEDAASDESAASVADTAVTATDTASTADSSAAVTQ